MYIFIPFLLLIKLYFIKINLFIYTEIKIKNLYRQKIYLYTILVRIYYLIICRFI